ncbi:PilZ domain-containing protein [Methylobacterium nonmethylotrophicum]|uniref:PilZ domain-containing protein n=1 Tax=Methylobacterium nonmethylotrophicum TaxID=1141884 RepID=A0A4Z0NH51_9HYPH|nr:PilZ domain-containing protein [Methylobacterium nonmethylotrophicum]TGD95614.1 PilZ domain-containing protein [Methylobacterium nonmethylotrophicum]
MTDLRQADGAGDGEGREHEAAGPIPRAGRRLRVVQQGRIVLGPDRLVSCQVLDVSAGGARLRLPARVTLPDAFTLVIAAHDLRTVAARLRWRRGDFAGVTFGTVGSPPDQARA